MFDICSSSGIEKFNETPPNKKVTNGKIINKLNEIEKKALMEALEQANGNIPQAAKALGISRATFYRKIKKYRSAS